ncbi:putative conserved plasma membrane protein [Operophtera brumata]|uniref:Putative conserved plasma membrane protein n=1 Tax=Operophtera brumata TaxID=104452 RepID=A0A0L7LHW2_OPEBR|nr:putative conserved plasma membrane protein [Operophtera brumata]
MSVNTNDKLMQPKRNRRYYCLLTFPRLRFMSVIWVIMVHTYLTVFYVADNKVMRIIIERSFFYHGILVTVLFLRTEDKKAIKKSEQALRKNVNGYTNSALSVSVISQQSFKEDLLDKPKNGCYSKTDFLYVIKNFFVLVSYRVVRLTPAYAFVIGLNEIALRWTHDNTVFEPAIYDHITCDKYWWRNILYINNLYPQKDMCMVWSWYMANDTQFYVVGIILLYDGRLVPAPNKVPDQDAVLAGGVGMAVCDGHPGKSHLQYGQWILRGVADCILPWGAAVAWVAISCCSGYGGLINSALSYRGFLPLSRLTYCAYLVHPTIMMYTSFLLDGPYHMQTSTVIFVKYKI